MSKRNAGKPKKTKGLGAGIIAFGVVFATFSVLFHPHSIGGYILAVALSTLFGSIVKVMGEGLDLSVKEKVPDSLKNMAADTGNPDVDALLSRGRDMIAQIHAESRQIPDAALTTKLNKLEMQCSEIFRTVYDKPAKVSQIRKFMDYYLPTTLKMVAAYRTLGERNMAGQDTVATRKRIDDALGVVLKGCQKMLDNLYRDDMLDITTDIDVLEQMLKRDGLTESDLRLAIAQAKQAAKIDRQVEAQRAAQISAKTSDSSQWQPGRETNVSSTVQNVVQNAAQHTPQVPVMYPADSAEAGARAQAPKQD